MSDRWFARVFHKWLRLAGSRRLHAEPHGGEDSDGCVRCYGTNVRPFAWSWLQPFTTAGVGGSERTKAYGWGAAGGVARAAAAGEDRRHTGVGYELVHRLEVLVPQMGEQLPDVLQFFAAQLLVVAEPVIEVPKILLDRTPQRLGDHLGQPQMVEQLVHVPTVVSYSSLQQITAEQIVDIPVPGRDGGGARGGLPGFAGQGSTASSSHVGAADGAGQGVFRTFPRKKKSAKQGPHSGSELSADFYPSTLSAHQMPLEQLVDVPVPQVHERSSRSLVYEQETRFLLESLHRRWEAEEAARLVPSGRGADG